MSAIVEGAPAVIADRVNKTFALPKEKVHTFKERALHPLRRTEFDVLHALNDVSFAVPHGEFFGIVGRNGSGKSTLLKCMAGIYGVDSGDIYVNGRLSTFIELGVGFNPDLAARDNATLNAIMLGLSKRDAEERYERILNFSELHEFEDLKIKNYSSGMLVRLAFSVMIQVDAQILLIDEVLAVGDAAFQQKCFDEFGRIRAEGRTVLLVTHDMAAVRRFCDRAMLLEHGDVVEQGEPERIGNRYLELNFSAEARAELAEQQTPAEAEASKAEPAEEEPREERYGDRRAEIVESWFENAAGARVGMLHTGEPTAFCSRVRFNEEVVDPLFGVNVENSQRVNVLTASNLLVQPQSGRFAAGDEVVFRIRFDNVFAADRYAATPAVAQGGSGLRWLDRRERFVTVVVTSTRSTDAVTDLDYEFSLAS